MNSVMGAAQDFGRVVSSPNGNQWTVNTTNGISTVVCKIAEGQGIYVDKEINGGAEPVNNSHSGDDFWDNWGFFTQRHKSFISALNPLRWPGIIATPLYHCFRRSAAGQSSTFKQIKTGKNEQAEVTYRLNRGIGAAAINLSDYGGCIRIKKGMVMGGDLMKNGKPVIPFHAPSRAHYIAPDVQWAPFRRFLGMAPPSFLGERIEGEGIVILAAQDGIIDIEPIEAGGHKNITERRNLVGFTKSVLLRPSFKKWGLDVKAIARKNQMIGSKGPAAIIHVTSNDDIAGQVAPAKDHRMPRAA